MFYDMNMDSIAKRNVWPNADNHVMAEAIPSHSSVNIPILNDNTLIIGKIRSGKTTFTKAYIEPLLMAQEEPYSVFFEIKDDFREYIRQHDKVVSFSSDSISAVNLFKWNIVKEIRESDDWEAELDELAGILFEDLLEDNRNRIWADGAKDVFKGYIKTILYCCKNSPPNGKVIDGMRFMDRIQFLGHLARYKQNYSLLRDYFEYNPQQHENYVFPKKGSDIMFFLQNVLGKFGGTFASMDGEDTIFDFLHGAYGKRLFLIYDYKKKDSSNLFFRYFLKKIINDRLSQNVDRSKKVLMVLDEIAELERDFGLMQAVTIGQGNNLQVIVITQSLEKLYCIVPDRNSDHIVNASLAGFRTLISFLPGDPQTIDIMQRLFGNRKKQTIALSVSRYAQPVIKLDAEPIVSDEAFASLGVGECYVKIREADPQRLKMIV